MRVIFMGTPHFAVPAFEALAHNGCEMAAVYTRADKPVGRGREQIFSPIKQAALALGAHILQPVSLRKPDVQSELAALSPDVIVVAAYGLILPPEVLGIPRYGCINLHPSLLPRHRGASPVMSTILSGDAWAGTSLMQMDAGLDTGPVIAQSRILVRDEDTTKSLTEKLSLISAQLLTDVLPRWIKEGLPTFRQNDSLTTYFKTIDKTAGEIDWNKPAVDIWREVRAYQPWPGSFTRFDGRLLKILETRPAGSDIHAPAGTVLGLENGCGVAAGDGILEIVRLQLEGKQAVSAADFVRGQRGFIGATLPG
ncbi:MAG: methionyl-tRNA formyltransferase [Dehalococcoidia bacterium]|nr:methionyl-tRNA formyltransferase [Dehalococcoidia bacterium]